jgi:hypothetical protein
MKDCFIQRELGFGRVAIILTPITATHEGVSTKLLINDGYLTVDTLELTPKGIALRKRLETALETVEEPKAKWV